MTKLENKSEIKNFTEGNLTSHLIKFAIPVLLSHLMMVFLNTVDMIVVGQRLGEAGTSAVSIGGSVAMFLNAFTILLMFRNIVKNSTISMNRCMVFR